MPERDRLEDLADSRHASSAAGEAERHVCAQGRRLLRRDEGRSLGTGRFRGCLDGLADCDTIRPAKHCGCVGRSSAEPGARRYALADLDVGGPARQLQRPDHQVGTVAGDVPVGCTGCTDGRHHLNRRCSARMHDELVAQVQRHHLGINEVIAVSASVSDAQLQRQLRWSKQANWLPVSGGVRQHSRLRLAAERPARLWRDVPTAQAPAVRGARSGRRPRPQALHRRHRRRSATYDAASAGGARRPR